ncbi:MULTISPECIES: hypothetical protein [Microbulbifer]|uniref:hypothetical protein n=1 Tax=Microbulbifer TaxID=48073 RepID=UPI001143494F|nr:MULTISPECIES: hypothetical protein [Microbulbifer]
MKKDFLRRSINYVLIPLGVGFGQCIAKAISSDHDITYAYIVLWSVLASILTFLFLMTFFPWWESKRHRLGKPDPVPVYCSPLLWLPLAGAVAYVFFLIIDA